MSKPISIPEAAQAAGMTRLAFADDFDSYDTIDMSGEGKPGYLWYADRPYGGSTLTADEVVVKDSVLLLRPKKMRRCDWVTHLQPPGGYGVYLSLWLCGGTYAIPNHPS